MGKITSLIEFHGSVGNLTGYRGRDGRNVIRQKIYNPRNAKTPLQMRRRVAWANLVALWQVLLGYMKPSFSNKSQGESDYNAFMKANVDANPVYLTKKEVLHGVCVVAPVQITRGSLQSINVTMLSGGKMSSDLVIADLELGSETTVGQFSHAVIQYNTDYRNGDQISFIQLSQAVGPKVQPLFRSVILDESSTELLWEGGRAFGFSSTNGNVCTNSAVNGGCAWIHSRLVDGVTEVSSQSLVVNNNILSEYTSKAAQDAAIASYGGQNVSPLTPTGNQYQPNENAMP